MNLFLILSQIFYYGNNLIYNFSLAIIIIIANYQYVFINYNNIDKNINMCNIILIIIELIFMFLLINKLYMLLFNFKEPTYSFNSLSSVISATILFTLCLYISKRIKTKYTLLSKIIFVYGSIFLVAFFFGSVLNLFKPNLIVYNKAI